MRSRYRFIEPNGTYFLTATIVEWLPILTRPAECNVILESLAFCRAQKGLRLHAYVIMENHLHLVASGPDISGTLRAFKCFTARQLVMLAEATGREWVLNQFEYFKQRHKAASSHQV